MDSTELKRRFGKQVQALRERKGLTQEQLAGRIARSVDTVSNIERGINATRIEVAHHIAVELGVALPDLFALNREIKKAEERETVAVLLDLVRNCDDITLRSLTDLVRVGLALYQRPYPDEESRER